VRRSYSAARGAESQSDDVIFFAHAYRVAASERAALDARGIAVVEGLVARLSLVDDRLDAVQLSDGGGIPRAAVFIRPALRPHRDGLIDSLGCAVGEGGFVLVDTKRRTSVSDVWAAGNVSNPRVQVISGHRQDPRRSCEPLHAPPRRSAGGIRRETAAAGEGSAAAIAINAKLGDEALCNTLRSVTA